MEVLKNELLVCASCGKIHGVQTVELADHTIFKGVEVHYSAIYDYCEITDELTCDEEKIASNDISMKNEYRKLNHLM